MVLNCEIKIRTDKNINLKNLSIPKLFENSKFVKEIKKINEKYMIKFYWKKFGIGKEFLTILEEFVNDSTFLVDSSKDSKYKFKIEITRDKNELYVFGEMNAGLMADIFGENDFKDFINDIVNYSINKYCLEKNNENELENNFNILKKYIPENVIIKIINGKWEEANQEITCILSKNIENLFIWLLKAYVCEKCNLQKLSEIYLNYIISKDKKILNTDLAILLEKDSYMISNFRKNY